MTRVVTLSSLIGALVASTVTLADYSFHFNISGISVGEIAASAPSTSTPLSCGRQSCYVIHNGTVWSVGLNNNGQLGLGDTTDRSVWSDTGFAADSVFAGTWSAYALRNGDVWSVGDNARGQLSLGDWTDRHTWSKTNFTADKIVPVGLGVYALVNGRVWAAGYNNYGALGLGDTTNRNTFTDTGFSADNLVAGESHAYALKDGIVWSVGYNYFKQLGRPGTDVCGTNNVSCSTTWGSTGFSADKVSAGALNGYALKNGTVWSVGDNDYGQLGRPSSETCMIGATPTPCSSTWGDTGFAAGQIYGSYRAAYALVGNEVWGVGDNAYGQLGVGDTDNRSSWTSSGFSADEFFPGNWNAFAVKDGELWTVGQNDKGQLGLGDNTNRLVWTPLVNPFGE